MLNRIRVLFFAFVCVFCFSSNSYSNEVSAQELFSKYHLYKSDENALKVIKYLSDEFSKIERVRQMRKNINSIVPVMCFYHGMVQETPHLKKKINDLPLSKSMSYIIDMESWNRDQLIGLMRNGYKEIDEAADLDCLWAIYAATGDMKAPLIIQDYLVNGKKEANPSVEKYLIMSAAEWSLKANLKHDSSLDKSKFESFLLTEENKAPENIAQELIQKGR